jgi:3-hydroxybutyrate dehydrogenase
MLEGRVALITGSTSGIGLGIAERLAKEGCHIMLNGFAPLDAEVTALQQRLAAVRGKEVRYISADVSKPAQVRQMIQDVEASLGSLDILVNNAGIQFTAKIEDFPEEKWDAIIAINLSAAFHSIKAAIPGMRQRNFGRIVNIASAHGLVASPIKSAYVAAKHGVVGLTKVVALEAAEQNITCNVICPGWVHTALVQKQIEDRAAANGTTVAAEEAKLIGEKQPNKRFATVEDIAAGVAYLCQTSAVTGTSLSIDGGWTAW